MSRDNFPALENSTCELIEDIEAAAIRPKEAYCTKHARSKEKSP